MNGGLRHVPRPPPRVVEGPQIFFIRHNPAIFAFPHPLENPHCGLTASCSTGRYFETSSTRRFIASTDSISSDLVVATPRTAIVPFRKEAQWLEGARSVSYSSSSL